MPNLEASGKNTTETTTFINPKLLKKKVSFLDPCSDLPHFKLAYQKRLELLGFTKENREEIATLWVEQKRIALFRRLKHFCNHINDTDIQTLNNLLMEQAKELIINTEDKEILQTCEATLKATNSKKNPKYFKFFLDYFLTLKEKAASNANILKLTPGDILKIEKNYNNLEKTTFKSDENFFTIRILTHLTQLMMLIAVIRLGVNMYAAEESFDSIIIALFSFSVFMKRYHRHIDLSSQQGQLYNLITETGEASIENDELIQATFKIALHAALNATGTHNTKASKELQEMFPNLPQNHIPNSSTSLAANTIESKEIFQTPKEKIKTKGKANRKAAKNKEKSSSSTSTTNCKKIVGGANIKEDPHTGDVVVCAAGSKSTYIKLKNEQFFLFNRKQLAGFYHTNIPAKTRDKEIDKVYTTVLDERKLDIAEESLKTHIGASFFGCKRKIRISGCDNRVGALEREPTELEKEAGITTFVNEPVKISPHTKNKR